MIPEDHYRHILNLILAECRQVTEDSLDEIDLIVTRELEALDEEAKKPVNDSFVRAVVGALRMAIHAHGPIDEAQVSSAAKRISGALRGVLKQERDRIMATQPRRPKGP